MYTCYTILNDKATQILSARYLNPSRDSRETKQANSVVVTVDALNVSALLQGSSSSLRNARLNLPSPPPEPPSVRTAGDTDTPINDAPPPTPRAPFVRFIILARLTDARIQPAPGTGTISQSHPVVRPRPPIAVTAVVTTLPRSGNVRLDLPRLSPPEPTPQPQPQSVKTPWIWRSMGARHPLLPRPGRVPLRWT